MADLSSLLGAAGVGGAIGKAIVSLELDTKKYTAEMEAAQAKTVAGTNSMSSGFSKFGGLASAALLGAGAAAVAFGAFSVKAAIEANDAHLKLTNTFKNNASLADSSVAAFEKQADALRDLTGTDDEAIIAGQALLGSFKLTGEQVQELTPRVVDLAAKYNIDLQTAFKAVGKATQGNAGILSRYGVTIDEAALKADGFGATLKGLGVAQGFAADRAKAEPWRVLGAQFEEVAEKLGQALLPVIENLTKAIIAILPFIEGLITGFIQLGHYAVVAAEHIAGFFDAISRGVPVTDDMVKIMGDAAKPFLDTAEAADKTGEAVQGAQGKIQRFAHMTKADLAEWSDKTKESFQTYVVNLDKVNTETDFTRKDLRDSFKAMLEHARDLNVAMRTLSREHWINDDFVKFLAEQPDKLILFADSNETQQRRMQHQWETSGEILRNKINDRLDVMTGVLDGLDNKTTKHTVEVVYKYTGFDPTKPGMTPGRKT
jgi:hypothetical protein